MKVIRSRKREQWAFKKIKAWLTRRPRSDDAWHVSDLIYPRKALFQRLDPQPITDKQSLYFIAGHGHHHVIEAVLGPKKTHDRTDSGEFKKMGIYFSPDLREEVSDWPIEIKTSRAKRAPDVSGEKPQRAYEGYLKQLASYMALMKKGLGGLLVLYLAHQKEGQKWGSEPVLRFYKVKMTKEERADKLADLKALAKKLTAAVKTKKAKGIPLCPKWMCGDCPFFKTRCKPWKTNESYRNAQKGK